MMDLRVLNRPLDLYVQGREQVTGDVTLRVHVDERTCRRVESCTRERRGALVGRHKGHRTASVREVR